MVTLAQLTYRHRTARLPTQLTPVHVSYSVCPATAHLLFIWLSRCVHCLSGSSLSPLGLSIERSFFPIVPEAVHIISHNEKSLGLTQRAKGAAFADRLANIVRACTTVATIESSKEARQGWRVRHGRLWRSHNVCRNRRARRSGSAPSASYVDGRY